MSISSVVRLEEYRNRREVRLRQTLAFHAVDGEKRRVAELLRDALTLLGADRAATLWIDEYGPGLVHVHCLVDLASDRPRTAFSVHPLKQAWEHGVPGFLDYPDMERAGGLILPEGPRSACAVALGSDGVRSWFLAVDSSSSRPALDRRRVGELLFLAGECSAVVLHRDLPASSSAREAAGERWQRTRKERFAGWPVLRDIEGQEDDDRTNRRIASRFLVVRVLRNLVDEDFAVVPDSLAYQVEGVRNELCSLPAGDPERDAWERLLAAAESADTDREELASAALELGLRVEAMGHLHGAREIHRTAYDVAVSTGSAHTAIDAARFQGRVCRRLAEWDDGEEWYGQALVLAEAADVRERIPVIMDGLAGLYRDRGNLPKARATLEREMEIARSLEDDYALAVAHHSYLALEKLGGRTDEALVHGWEAVRHYGARSERLFALFDLGGVFVERGDLSQAEDAYRIVTEQAPAEEYRIVAANGLAYVSALRGDIAGFTRWASRTDAALQDASPVARCQILLYRGQSHVALGETSEARRRFKEALRLAESHRLSQSLFEAEAALADLDEAADTADHGTARPPAESPGDHRLEEIRRGLRDLRRELVGSEA